MANPCGLHLGTYIVTYSYLHGIRTWDCSCSTYLANHAHDCTVQYRMLCAIQCKSPLYSYLVFVFGIVSSSTAKHRFGDLTSSLTFALSFLGNARSVSSRCWHVRLAGRLEPTPKLRIVANGACEPEILSFCLNHRSSC